MIVKVEKIVPEAKALAYFDNKVVFIEGLLLDEVAEVRVTLDKKDYLEAEVIKIIEPSPLRRIAPCVYYNECGGCNLQHTTYENQITLKQEIIRNVFKRIGKKDNIYFETYPSPEWAYRHRSTFHITDQGNLSFKKRKSNALTPIKSCPILIKPLESLLNKKFNTYYTTITQFASKEGVYSSIDHEYCYITIKEKLFKFSSSGFFQGNPFLLETMVDFAIEGTGSRALDLYSGSGLFAAFLADHFKEVVAVEIEENNASLIRENVKSPNLKVFVQDVDKVMHKKELQNMDLIVVDPPRKGLSAKVVQNLLLMRPKQINYISCNPVTLARDIVLLEQGGYSIKKIAFFDCFPQTGHIEMGVQLIIK